MAYSLKTKLMMWSVPLALFAGLFCLLNLLWVAFFPVVGLGASIALTYLLIYNAALSAREDGDMEPAIDELMEIHEKTFGKAK